MIASADEARAHYERLSRLVTSEPSRLAALIGILSVAADSCDDATLGQVARVLLDEWQREQS